MKRICLASLSLLLPLAMNGQIVRGDMDGNGRLNIADVTLLVNAMLGNAAVEEVGTAELAQNDLLAGTWYLTKTESINFTAEGTTDYGAATHFRFFPDLGYIILTDGVGYATDILNVTALDADRLVINGAVTYTRSVPAVYVASVTLNVATLQLFPSGSQQIAASVLPADADNRGLTWSSSNTQVATVADGLVTAVGPGTATITCMAADGSGVTASCLVSVTPSDGLPGTQVPEGSGA